MFPRVETNQSTPFLAFNQFCQNFRERKRREREREMEEEGIGLVLARATELRLKIGNCIHKATSPRKVQDDPLQENDNGVHGGAEEEEEEEEAQGLLNICDALESLETQLSSLQVCFSKLHFFLIRRNRIRVLLENPQFCCI